MEPRFDMDRLEIVEPRASGEAFFSRLTEKWLWGMEMDKMVKRGRLLMHLQRALELFRQWSRPQTCFASLR